MNSLFSLIWKTNFVSGLIVRKSSQGKVPQVGWIGKLTKHDICRLQAFEFYNDNAVKTLKDIPEGFNLNLFEVHNEIWLDFIIEFLCVWRIKWF